MQTCKTPEFINFSLIQLYEFPKEKKLILKTIETEKQ